MFWKALRPLLADNTTAEAELDAVRDGFGDAMAEAINAMWASKLGLSTPAPELAQELLGLMLASKLDYTIFFRQLSEIPDSIEPLKASFYAGSTEELDGKWHLAAALARTAREPRRGAAWRLSCDETGQPSDHLARMAGGPGL